MPGSPLDPVMMRIGRSSAKLKPRVRRDAGEPRGEEHQPALEGPTPLHELDDQDDHGNDQEQMNEPTKGIGRDQPEEPQHQQHHTERPQHRAVLLLRSFQETTESQPILGDGVRKGNQRPPKPRYPSASPPRQRDAGQSRLRTQGGGAGAPTVFVAPSGRRATLSTLTG